MLEFIEIDVNDISHIEELYTLLKSRIFSISHKEIPCFNDHLNFVMNTKYRNWCLVKRSSKTIGSFYLTNENIIGVNLLYDKYEDYIETIKQIIKHYKPLEPIASFRSKYFLINVNPNNEILIKALKYLEMDHIQNTYAYTKPQ